MRVIDRLRERFPAGFAVLEPRFSLMKKATSFALVGVINALIDAAIFFLVYGWLSSQPAALRALGTAAEACGCGSARGIALVVANIVAWFVAVSASYVMNSYTTFAAESGRVLRLGTWAKFAASGILGVAAGTTTLVIAAEFMPVWLAKAISILVGFLVNFSMSHFVVFRRAAPAEAPRKR